ncbi:hypothetical protein GQ43DRAFT_438031 [Delitschia confertaspora ATCC 74209]|uniref:Uncharacterized protein n=1 Tax=Delitschia confertaspora ATCC 74209 TaxID=1513339 RepID=A0A9P4JS20_9PLEO|nr:hypothetical protein GQ43DRAFT_438031 [Delitschia confertaspora ATCC 74209]
MKLTALFLALSSGIVLAAPVSDIQKREDEVGVYLCNDRGYSGYCQHIITSSGDCIPLEWDLLRVCNLTITVYSFFF